MPFLGPVVAATVLPPVDWVRLTSIHLGSPMGQTGKRYVTVEMGREDCWVGKWQVRDTHLCGQAHQRTRSSRKIITVFVQQLSLEKKIRASKSAGDNIYKRPAFDALRVEFCTRMGSGRSGNPLP